MSSNKQTNKAILLLGLFLVSPVWAGSNLGTPENPECTSKGEPVIPKAFMWEIQQEINQNPLYEEPVPPGGDTEIHSDLYYLKKYPHFEERLRGWRVQHGLPAIVDCSVKPDARLKPSTPGTMAAPHCASGSSRRDYYGSASLFGKQYFS